MSPQFFAAAALLSALLAIALEWRERRHAAFYLLKPLTTLLIIGIAASSPAGDARTFMLVALSLSLVGDVCLMFSGNMVPERSEVGAGAGKSDVSRSHLLTQDAVSTSAGERWFIGGLGSFLLAHLAFIPALLHGVVAPTLPWWSVVLVIFGIAFFAWLLPKTGALKLAVLIYGSVLTALALAAIARWNVQHSDASLMALVGALLFVLSDSSLSIRQFVTPYRGAQALILSTYWLAIGLMAFSVTLTTN